MDLLDKLGRLARLAGVVGLALGATAISVCSRSPHESTTPDARVHDGGQGQDAAVDSAAPDAGPDAGAPDADRPDARLWDVICE